MIDRDTNLKIPDPPRGIKAIPWRLPIWIYRLRLGWLLGHRALLLTHKGRLSGKTRTAMLEVIKYEEDTNTHYVASGFGEKSDWYQNIVKTPQVTIQVGNKRFAALADRLSTDQAIEIFLDYRERHPKAIKNLANLIGYDIGETEEQELAFLRLIPVIAFRLDK
jgi:deazaflavin-dependent oxidoreductase (nitroreductase family)